MKKLKYSDGTTPKICIVGAGFSGVLAGIKLKTELGIETYTIFDENNEVGGTWLVNTYPGCACDVQSHLYSYSFEPNPYWSHAYSSREEIWEYVKKVAQKYSLYEKIQFKSRVSTLAWDETLKKWRVDIVKKNESGEDVTTQSLFDIVINSPGALRIPNVPEEFKKFNGTLVHSAKWDNSLDLSDKVVGIIGSGSTAIQIIGEIGPNVKELHCYQRKPAWVMPRRQLKIPNFVQWLFANVPFLLLLFRWSIFLICEIIHGVFINGSWLSRFAKKEGLHHLNAQISKDKDLKNALTPNYKVGCKRIVVSNEYYPAIALPHVKLHRDEIVKVEENEITTKNGSAQKLDVLILATGFTVQDFFAPMEVIGKNNVSILDEWRSNKPTSLYGIVGDSTPNQFLLLGPNTGLGHNSVVFMIECQMNFVSQLIREMIERDARVLEVRPSAVEKFQSNIEEGLKKTVWGNEKCGSWYANKRGVITTLWPCSCIAYWAQTRKPDFNQFKFE